ncbi:MAPEG family protein [Maricaulis sp.]|uniref:MAPEG family protein n=1 Tax=Maricaulis sp. TaxID=1486257 RepID=UPI001B09FDA2|nr:MAPEG family protein [Maricaulis sp.]MBO6798537.1 MAPEG family protein [Maricaulis sp.]
MTIELWTLLMVCALALFLSSVPLFRAMRQQWGFKAMLGNREDLTPLTGWGGRVVRAYGNTVDNIVFFGAVVIAAHLADVSNEITAAGALTFLACRFIYAIVYMLGVPIVRTVAYLGGVIGTLIIASQLL